MSHRSPVYLLPLAEGAIPPRTPEATRAMVAKAAEAPEISELRTAVSSDSWHPTLAAKLARGCSIEGLGFLANELRVLSPLEARAAARSSEWTVLPNKEMKLTSVEHIGRSQIVPSVRQTRNGAKEV